MCVELGRKKSIQGTNGKNRKQRDYLFKINHKLNGLNTPIKKWELSDGIKKCRTQLCVAYKILTLYTQTQID